MEGKSNKKLLFVILFITNIYSISYASDNKIQIGNSIDANTGTGSENKLNFRVSKEFAPIAEDINPLAGITIWEDSSIYANFGLVYTKNLADNIDGKIYTSVGYFNGQDIDLGYEIEFMSGVEVLFKNSGISVGVSHISNASLSDQNPGLDNIYLQYSVNS